MLVPIVYSQFFNQIRRLKFVAKGSHCAFPTSTTAQNDAGAAFIRRPLLDNGTRNIRDLIQITRREENEQALVERVLVNLRNARAIRGAPELIFADYELVYEESFGNPPIAVRDCFEKEITTLEVV
ncbi:hypothetical protein [Methylorubrum thiocyanatum]|uniref:hypothetical protein n=1 Tax=Methylorubrum thiocyanatum TaxID=47958 RepID=UPI003F7DEDA4